MLVLVPENTAGGSVDPTRRVEQDFQSSEHPAGAKMRVSWDGQSWKTSVALPLWRHYIPGDRGGIVPVVFNPERSQESIEPTQAQLAAVRFIIDKQAELLAEVEKALRRYYDRMRSVMLTPAKRTPSSFPNLRKRMPEHPSPRVLGRLHPLHAIYVQPTAAKELAHVGFAFHAARGPGHGVGVLTHGLKVRKIGDEDTATLQRIAEQDAANVSGGVGEVRKAPERRSEQAPERKSEQAPERKSEQAPERKSEQAPEHRSEQVHRRRSGQASDRKSKEASDRISKATRETKNKPAMQRRTKRRRPPSPRNPRQGGRA